MFNFEAAYSKLHKHLHFIYLLYAIPLVCLTATITPPLQNPDEPNHFLRAEQVSRLDMVPTFVYDKSAVSTKNDSLSADPRIIYPDKGGFAIDKGILDLEGLYSAIQFHPEAKVRRDLTKRANDIKWGFGTGYKNFGNTAIYPPVVYIMPAIGIAAGKLLHLSIVKTLYLSRILNGALSVAICFFALMLARRGNILMFIVLLFPMTIALFASVSQDAILIACVFLLVAAIDNVEFRDDKIYRRWHIYTMVIAMCIIGIAKPPYIPLAFIFLLLKLSPRAKAAGIILPLLSIAAWLIINHANFAIKFAPPELRTNAKLQVQYIIHHPFNFIGLFFKFDLPGLTACLHSFIGILGWLDLTFPTDYYHTAYVIVFAGIIIGISPAWKENIRLKTGLLICAFITIIAILTAQYVTWTALEATSLGGMQGRYLLPVAPFLALALSGKVTRDKFTRLKSALFMAILLFPIYSSIEVVHGLFKRYYG
ncbi:DUF2142 domain-containing protein [Mucilaginibacter sabulilitoris]|uniref:DUF2142 domain-containing protein n=1 Tax=Mucilaginibacter sabulilitoris TaxID=1173583 RepID=A0ABZ0TIP8_9SPHI|nr:DUF2142 domain-containing protein [Mucilaginibacter sabulilitoris]WPU93059.1 DUF2142 domain-containing protein [Mucilaginibacter sabulilitoris]